MDQSYHFIGIGGIGMSALAKILLQKGSLVSGSDNSQSVITEGLNQLGALIQHGHNSSNIKSSAVVVYSTDIKEDNPEIIRAKELGLKIIHRSELMRLLMQDKKSLLVTGTHGKTTTSSLLSYTLAALDHQPTFAVGGLIKNFGSNSNFGKGDYFIAEADESDGSFLAYPAYGAIITNIDLDHLNFWKTEQALIDGFKLFAENVENKNLLFWCKDDQRMNSLDLKGLSYGFDESADFRIYDFFQKGLLSEFSIEWNNKRYEKIIVPLIGKHNALNAAAVFALCLQLGANEEELKSVFTTFKGISRRADYLGSLLNIHVYDDYGHHPTEIQATLAAFKEAFPANRLVCLFQPHRFSRTKDCFEQFVSAFDIADVLILTDIYSAGESPIEGVDSFNIYERICQRNLNHVYYIRKNSLIEFLKGFVRENDVVLTMGAGDITKSGSELLSKLRELQSL